MFYLFTDGGSRGNPGISAAGCFIFDDKLNLVSFDAKYLGIATNNYAEYNALKLGLKLAQKLKIKDLTCTLDSELVVKQLNGEYKVKDENIRKLYNEIQRESKSFSLLIFNHVLREENKNADKMVNIILDVVSQN